jgi:hypothetical protein
MTNQMCKDQRLNYNNDYDYEEWFCISLYKRVSLYSHVIELSFYKNIINIKLFTLSSMADVKFPNISNSINNSFVDMGRGVTPGNNSMKYDW